MSSVVLLYLDHSLRFPEAWEARPHEANTTAPRRRRDHEAVRRTAYLLLTYLSNPVRGSSHIPACYLSIRFWVPAPAPAPFCPISQQRNGCSVQLTVGYQQDEKPPHIKAPIISNPHGEPKRTSYDTPSEHSKNTAISISGSYNGPSPFRPPSDLRALSNPRLPKQGLRYRCKSSSVFESAMHRPFANCGERAIARVRARAKAATCASMPTPDPHPVPAECETRCLRNTGGVMLDLYM
ncbi:hypothetical protein CC78DRAFT_242966 [Lojkania enalia]|uniref:Uncharacterized protein n=1 Tax=Lojkania enalia TaxID=147567 RepID=A0A9P4NB28_9PLEO|nr:hypothetical protein CC78DRAFT_242966 [Didymosphaeria enalia]